MVKRKAEDPRAEDRRALRKLLVRLHTRAVLSFGREEDLTEERVADQMFHLLALEFPRIFQALRKDARAARPQDRELLAMLDEIHGELWEPPEERGRPTRGGAVLLSEELRRRDARAKLDALTALFAAELAGERWHGRPEDPSDPAAEPTVDTDELDRIAAERLRAAFGPKWRTPGELVSDFAKLSPPGMEPPPDLLALVAFDLEAKRERKEIRTEEVNAARAVVDRLMDDVMRERGKWTEERRGSRTVRLHRPQEWAARALLALWGCPETWEAALSLLHELTRGEEEKRRKPASRAGRAAPKGLSRG